MANGIPHLIDGELFSSFVSEYLVIAHVSCYMTFVSIFSINSEDYSLMAKLNSFPKVLEETSHLGPAKQCAENHGPEIEYSHT